MDIKKIIGQIVFITMITSGISFASTYHVELNASYSAIEARFDNTLALEQGVLTTGIGAIYSDDDYKIANVKLTLGDGILLPGLKFNLGFKGILGGIEKDNKQGDLMAIGFLFSGKYSIPEAVSPIPIDVSVGINVAPEPLCTRIGTGDLELASIFVLFKMQQLSLDIDTSKFVLMKTPDIGKCRMALYFLATN